MTAIQERLRGRLVASCQADPGNPLDDTDAIRRIARAVVAAGAAGLRINSPEHISAIRRDTDLPIIGIQKRYEGGRLRITPDFPASRELVDAGASIIAMDCTNREWSFGEPWRQLLARIRSELKVPVMADVATLAEAIEAERAGADFVGTTLNGYTEETAGVQSFNWPLLAEMVRRLKIPIIAEGHLSTPTEARRAVAAGAWCVVIGSAITRPGAIAAGFVDALKIDAGGSAIGVDIGGTSIKAGVVDRAGAVRLTVQVPTNASLGRATISNGLAEAIEQVLAQAGPAEIQFCGIGIASAGAINASDGSVFAATENLPGWAGFPLCQFVRERFSLPAYAVNDAQAAAFSELRFGLGRELRSFVSITLGTGIGGGIVVHGALLKGEKGFAGTIGHQVIRANGEPCNCGRRGCLEAYVSSASLVREYAARAGGKPDADGSDSAQVKRISEFASAGDDAALQAYASLAGYLAEGLANVFNILDPEAVFLSGGLVEGHPELVAKAETRVTQMLHFGSKRKPRIELAAQGYYAGVQGAGAFVFDELAS